MSWLDEMLERARTLPPKLLVVVPGGWNPSWGTSVAAFLASIRYHVDAEPSCHSGPNFNAALQLGMNALIQKDFTHCVHLHTDTGVRCDRTDVRYADVMIEELDAHDADFISVCNTIKDERLLTSAGVGDPATPWNPFRRFTTKEFKYALPPTFTAEMIGYGDKYLLHNNACAMWDLRKPVWWKTDENGVLLHCFNFTERMRLGEREVLRDVDSEDWAYSRQMWKLGAKTILTSKIELLHTGTMTYSNRDEGGTYQAGDDATRANWAESAPDWNMLQIAGAVVAEDAA